MLLKKCFCGVSVKRAISVSATACGKKNFRKFILPSRGTEKSKKARKSKPLPDVPSYNYGVRDVGLWQGGQYVIIPEKIPEIIVPDLTDFKLKPYVSYRVSDINQSKFTAKDLFNAVYAKKIVEDHKSGKLDEFGNPLEPSHEEKLTPEEALVKARQTGCDIFTPRSKREEEELYMTNY